MPRSAGAPLELHRSAGAIVYIISDEYVYLLCPPELRSAGAPERRSSAGAPELQVPAPFQTPHLRIPRELWNNDDVISGTHVGFRALKLSDSDS